MLNIPGLRKFAALYLLPAMLLLLPTAHADTTFVNTTLVPTGTLTGTALLSGEPSHAGIMIYVAGTSIIGATNASGQYTIIGVPYGSYTLTMSKAGFNDQTASGITVSTAGQVVSVTGKTLVPNSSQVALQFAAAMRKYSYDDFSGAISQFRAVVSAEPAGQWAAASLYRVGLAFSALNRIDSAITAFSQLITTYPADSLVADAYYWRGAYKDQKLDYAGALSDFQYVLTHYPAYPIAGRAQYRIGREQEVLGNYAQAISAYLAVETNYPASPDIAAAIYNAAWLYYSQDDWSNAVTQFNKLLTSYAATDEAAKASYYKGMCYFNQENFNQALTQFTSSISTYPTGSKVVDSWYYRAQCKYDLESYTYAQAKADFQSIITNFPNSDRVPHCRYYLASCEYALGNFATAISLYQSFISAEPANDFVPNARKRIADAYYFGLADYTAALAAYQTCYSLYPNDKSAGEAHYWAGRCQERLGFTAQAVTEYCTVITQYPNCSDYANAVSRRDGLGVTTCP